MGTYTRALVISLVAVVAAFIGSTIWAQRAARGIEADAVFISRDAAPGIETISDLRAELRDIQAKVIRTVHGRETGEGVAASRHRIDALLARALALPIDPPEAVLFGKLQAAMRAYDEAVERALEQTRTGQRAQAFRTVDDDLRPLADRVGEAAKDLVEYDARTAQRAAERIETARANANRIAYQLDAISAALAIGAAFFAWRAIRQVHRVQQENQRLVERKAEELEQFAGRVAHDILSPLSAVGMALSIAERSAPQAHDALARGSSSLQRVRGIVDALLEFARAGARPTAGVRSQVAPVVAGLAEELQPFAEQRNATLKIDPVPESAVSCSPGVLLSVLSNLLRNAIKYLGDSAAREVSLRVKPRRGRVIFEVEDTGPGIPPEARGRIFEPYVRGPNSGAAPGIGLGLATVKRLVESHGGYVGVREGARGGSLFWFELDEAPTEPRQAEAASVHLSA